MFVVSFVGVYALYVGDFFVSVFVWCRLIFFIRVGAFAGFDRLLCYLGFVFLFSLVICFLCVFVFFSAC